MSLYQFFPYIILLIFSFSMLIFLAIYGFQYRQNLGVNEFIFAMLTSAWWVFSQAFELMAVTLPVKLFWANIEYLGTVSTFAYFMLSMKFTGYDKYLSKKNIIMVFSIFAFFYILVFTDPYHGLMRTNFLLDTSAVPYTIDKDYGVLYPVYILFTYSMNTASLVLLAVTAIKKDSLYRKQAVILFVGLGFIALTNILYILGLSPVKRFDVAPAFFGISALVLSWGVFHHKLLNIMPIARDLLVERLSSGVIVVDRDNVIIDINHSALTMFDLQKSEMIGMNISEIPIIPEDLLQNEDLLQSNDNERQTRVVVSNSNENRDFIYEIKKHLFKDKKEKTAGVLYVFNDITEQQRNLEKIIQQQKVLSVMSERERMGRELHDGLGQMFGYINAQAQTVKEYMIQQKYSKAMNQMEALISVSRDAHSGIRDYISEIRGIAPRNRSFSAALKQYISAFTERHGIPVAISFDENLPENFPEESKAIHIMKIIQESLNNVKKHAGKCTASISFVKKDAFTEVSICDNGIGFDIHMQDGVDKYGLSIMRERAEEIGAGISIHSEKGVGTEIRLKIRDGGV